MKWKCYGIPAIVVDIDYYGVSWYRYDSSNHDISGKRG
jgi:hypothetical protein